ncbi:MAG: OmpH family outer membrane protein [Chlorobi bacterium]|nr:MAG: Outer membrane chaperone Skp [Chlorobi bacterium OLB7]MBK8912459.1 OmpH family outer membrane protein [Chlorobiota bacterium]MBX7217645.1 OmpH family outer membrane protein [Candidatus Kapabacteria bacterium]MCE7934558.1 OmpH family outer membrane protein [Chlorobi bacterium CHB2]
MTNIALRTLGCVLFSLLVLHPSAANAQLRIGYVETETIISTHKEFKAVEAQLQVYRKQFEDTLGMLKAKYDQELEDYQKKQATMAPDAKQQREGEILQLRDYILQYQQAKFGQQGDILAKQNELLMPLREKIKKIIAKVAKEEKVAVVFENSNLVYIDQDPKTTVNITFKVLDYLSRESQ